MQTRNKINGVYQPKTRNNLSMVFAGSMTALMLLSIALFATDARSSAAVIAPAPAIVRREEPVGGSCSPEGQWNCMPDTWQRCAAGRWSEVMHLADGTVCTPGGLTEEVDIEHDGSVDGGEGDDGSRTQSAGHGNALALLLVWRNQYLPLIPVLVLWWVRL